MASGYAWACRAVESFGSCANGDPIHEHEDVADDPVACSVGAVGHGRRCAPQTAKRFLSVRIHLCFEAEIMAPAKKASIGRTNILPGADVIIGQIYEGWITNRLNKCRILKRSIAQALKTVKSFFFMVFISFTYTEYQSIKNF